MHEIIDLEDWVPKTGFLRRYLEWTANHEGPLRFQFWTALTVLSAVVGRRFYLSKGFYHVYPNLYTILIAPTGRCRKTRTSSIGVSLLNTIDMRILASKFTPEDLISRLETIDVRGTVVKKSAEGFMYASELTVLLSKQKYNDGLIDLLTDFADAPDSWSYSTKGGGKIELYNVLLVMLACSTSEWLGDAIPQRAFGGGFLARIIFIVQDQTKRFFDIPEEQDEGIKNELISFLQKVRSTTGIFGFAESGREYYRQWYVTNRDAVGDLRLNGYTERRPDHLLRVAMLLSISEEGDLLLSEDVLRRAESILLAVEPSMGDALNEVNSSSSGRDTIRVYKLIVQHDTGVSREALTNSCLQFMQPKLIDETIKGLVTAGKITERITPIGKYYTKK